MELQFGDSEQIEQINRKQPKKIIKRRKIQLNEIEEENELGYEEYYDYIFPEENTQMKNLKMLQKTAQLWKQKQVQQQEDNAQQQQ